jgi:dolichyl-phosphate beta-glucosyltransferase
MKEVFLSVVIPIYNEENRILKSLKKIIHYFSNKGINFEIILVNDGSIDRSLEIIKNFQEEKSNFDNLYITIIDNKENKGKGFSIREGIMYSNGEFVLFTDADLSTPIDHLDEFLSYLRDDYSIAIASRGLPDSRLIISQNVFRKNMGKIFNFIVRSSIKLPFKDTQCGFKLFKKKAAKKIFQLVKISDFSFDVEVLYIAKQLGYKIVEIPVTWENSADSKVSVFKDSVKMFMSVLKIKKMHSDLKN